mgnify:CR=1 FL=1
MTSNLTVRITQDFQEDLEILCGAVQQNGTKLNKTEAVKLAVQRLADTYRSAWDYADVQEPHAPIIVSYRYRTDSGQPSWVPTVPHLNIIERKAAE